MPPHHSERGIAANAQAYIGGFVCDMRVTDDRIQRALDLIRSSPGFDLIDVAATLNLSASRLRHLFKNQTGLSPGQYTKVLRLERAKSLLESTFLTVKEIAARVGANDVSHFVRDYKATYGHTPTNARTRWVSHDTRPSGNSRQFQLLFPLQCHEEPAKALKTNSFRRR